MSRGKKIILVVMLVLAALMGLMSAYGASCPAFNPGRLLELDPGETEPSANSLILYAVITNIQWVFIVANILTYVAGVATILMIVALFKKWKWFYNATLATASLGVVSGFTPYLLIALNGGSTPSYMRTIIYAIVIILLVIPGFRRSFNKDGITQTHPSGPNSKSNIVSALLFFPGTLIWVQSLVVGPSHLMTAANYTGMVQALQIGSGLVLMSIGLLLYVITKIKSLRK